jgi:hypothetical protein
MLNDLVPEAACQPLDLLEPVTGRESQRNYAFMPAGTYTPIDR